MQPHWNLEKGRRRPSRLGIIPLPTEVEVQEYTVGGLNQVQIYNIPSLGSLGRLNTEVGQREFGSYILGILSRGRFPYKKEHFGKTTKN